MLSKRMWSHIVLLICLALLGAPAAGKAASATDLADVLSGISDAMRNADDARDLYYRNKSGSEAERYEREWREREYQLEESRIREMAREARVSPEEIGRMRSGGRSWQDISDRYRLDPRRLGYGHKSHDGYDRDSDRSLRERMYRDNPGLARGHYKGTPAGPPGQYKKNKDKDRERDWDRDRDRDYGKHGKDKGGKGKNISHLK